MYFIQNCIIFRPSDSTVSEDAGIEPKTVATLTLVVRRSINIMLDLGCQYKKLPGRTSASEAQSSSQIHSP